MAQGDRQALRIAWARYYSGCSHEEMLTRIRERVSYLEGRMRKLARFPQAGYKGFDKRSLTTALGMSLGVHKQLLAGLISVPRGGMMKGGGRAW